MFELELDLSDLDSVFTITETENKKRGRDVSFQGTRNELRAYIDENFGFTFNETITYNPQKKDSAPSYSELELTFKMCSNEALYSYLKKKFKEKLQSNFTWHHPVIGKDKKIVGYFNMEAKYE